MESPMPQPPLAPELADLILSTIAATRRENSPGASDSVPLNIMCSRTWATPVRPLTSSIEPARYQTIWATVGARRSGLTSTFNPLGKLRSTTCWEAGAGAVCEDGVAFCAATRAQVVANSPETASCRKDRDIAAA